MAENYVYPAAGRMQCMANICQREKISSSFIDGPRKKRNLTLQCVETFQAFNYVVVVSSFQHLDYIYTGYNFFILSFYCVTKLYMNHSPPFTMHDQINMTTWSTHAYLKKVIYINALVLYSFNACHLFLFLVIYIF